MMMEAASTSKTFNSLSETSHYLDRLQGALSGTLVFGTNIA
jgi:hypothetical protein